MTSLLRIQLDNELDRYETLLRTGRRDRIAHIVLDRMERQINILKRKVNHEENTGQKVATCASAGGFTRRIRQAVHRYWTKCYGNNHAIPSIPAIKTL